MSYNILADLYLDLKNNQQDLYFPYCSKEFQEYNYRYPVLLKEIPGSFSSSISSAAFLKCYKYIMKVCQEL